MAAPHVSTEEEFLRFLGDCATDRLKRELLAFWGRHPNARFSRGVICCALDFARLDVDRALKQMVETGLVELWTQNDSTPLYSLTTDEEIRHLALEAASLGCTRGHRGLEEQATSRKAPTRPL